MCWYNAHPYPCGAIKFQIMVQKKDLGELPLLHIAVTVAFS